MNTEAVATATKATARAATAKRKVEEMDSAVAVQATTDPAYAALPTRTEPVDASVDTTGPFPLKKH